MNLFISRIFSTHWDKVHHFTATFTLTLDSHFMFVFFIQRSSPARSMFGLMRGLTNDHWKRRWSEKREKLKFYENSQKSTLIENSNYVQIVMRKCEKMPWTFPLSVVRKFFNVSSLFVFILSQENLFIEKTFLP